MDYASSPPRRSLTVRVTHWVNLLALLALLPSGLQIFNAHPALYWGDRSDRDRPLLAMQARTQPDGDRVGITRVFGREFETTGALGYSRDSAGVWRARGFPAWATLPSDQWLAMGRRWHLFFAWVFVINGFVYLTHSLYTRHLRRDVVPARRDLRDLGNSIVRHLLFRHETAADYNPVQKLTYTIVILALGPLALLTGLSMSPWIDAAVPISDLFGGRQAARTLHFVVAFGLLAFVIVHVVMVLLTGPIAKLRGMITGRS